MSTLAILNPASGGGAGQSVARMLEGRVEAGEIDWTLRLTRAPGEAEEMAAAAAREGVRRIVVGGGDGTIHEVANGVLDIGSTAADRPKLGIIPIGTGNDFYRLVGERRPPAATVDALAGAEPHRFDAGRARWEGGSRFFINLMGVGVDVEVLRRRSAFHRLGGLAQYLAALASAVVRYEPLEVRVHLDGAEAIQDRTMLSAVTIGPSVGGGFQLSPEARSDDGLLDLCFIEALTLFQVARYLPKVVRGRHAGLPVVRMRQFRAGRFESVDGTPLYFQLDGELMEEPAPHIDLSVVPAALDILVPEGTGR